MGLNEISDPPHNLFHGVFQDVMAAIFKAMDHGVGPPLPPFRQEMVVKDKILRPPAHKHRRIVEPLKLARHESQRGDPWALGLVRNTKMGACL